MSTSDERTVLRLLTFENPAPPAEPCQGTYTCGCSACQQDRADGVKRGVRRDRSSPFRRQAA